MERKHLRPLALVLALVMLLMLAACGGGGSTGTQTSATNPTNAPSGGQQGSAATSAPASASKHLNAAIYWTAATIDPAVDYDGWTSCRAGITETLVMVDENLQLVPLLADSWTQPDTSTWVMHIREGVTFHNGKKVDAEAVKACLERTMEMNSRAVSTAKIASIEADGQNLTIRTTEPFGAFLSCMSEPLYSIIDVTDPADPATSPVGTGPFKVTSFKAEEVIELEKYAGYWNGASPLDTVTLLVISDDSTRCLALQSGQIDMGQRIASADIDTLKNDPNYDVYETAGTRIQILVLNNKNQFLSDVNVRKALACSLNYDALVAITGSLYSVAGAPYPSSAPYGYDQLDRQHYDADAAKACLAASGYADSDGNGYVEKDGKELTLSLMYDDKSMATALEAIQNMAKAVGIKITLQPVDSMPELNEDSFEIGLKNWQTLSTGDPQWMLDNMYKTGGTSNSAQYSNAELDALCNKLTGAFDTAERQKIVIEAEKIILADCVNIMMFSKNNFVMTSNKVKNVTVFPIDYYFLTNTVDISG